MGDGSGSEVEAGHAWGEREGGGRGVELVVDGGGRAGRGEGVVAGVGRGGAAGSEPGGQGRLEVEPGEAGGQALGETGAGGMAEEGGAFEGFVGREGDRGRQLTGLGRGVGVRGLVAAAAAAAVVPGAEGRAGRNVGRGEVGGELRAQAVGLAVRRQVVVRGVDGLVGGRVAEARRGRDRERIGDRHAVPERTGLALLVELGTDDVFDRHRARVQGVWGMFADVLAVSLGGGEERVQRGGQELRHVLVPIHFHLVPHVFVVCVMAHARQVGEVIGTGGNRRGASGIAILRPKRADSREEDAARARG